MDKQTAVHAAYKEADRGKETMVAAKMRSGKNGWLVVNELAWMAYGRPQPAVRALPWTERMNPR